MSETDAGALVRHTTAAITRRSSELVRRGLASLSPRPMRVLRFPEERSIGELSVFDSDRFAVDIERVISPFYRGYESAISFDEARGVVSIPSEFCTCLRSIDPADCGWLKTFRPDDFAGIGVWRFDDETAECDISFLANLSELRSLELDYVIVDGAATSYFRCVPWLRRLALRLLPSFPMEGYSHIQQMTALRALDLQEMALPDTGLAFLRGMPYLKTLMIGQMAIGEDDLGNLEALALRELSLSEVPLTAGGVDKIRRLTTLDHLGLFRVPITATGIEMLKHLDLTYLALVPLDGIPTRCLDHIAAMGSLRKLVLPCGSYGGIRNPVDADGRRFIKRALPHCVIWPDPEESA